MPTRKRKHRKLRGWRSHAVGSPKKHRGGHGNSGGAGLAGSLKHKKLFVKKNMPNHIGKHGFKSVKTKTGQKNSKTINVRDLEKLAAGTKEVNLALLGYGKLLGTGSISSAITVTVDSFTPSAKEKIEAAGGKIAGEESKEPKA